MDTLIRFLYEFLNQFFMGFITAFLGIINGFKQTFNVPAYIGIINDYKADFNGAEWIGVIIAILLIIVVFGLIVFGIILLVKKYFRFRKTLVEQESLLEEVAELNNKVATMAKEKEDILAMKVSQLGLKPGESPIEDGTSKNNNEDAVDQTNAIRFA